MNKLKHTKYWNYVTTALLLTTIVACRKQPVIPPAVVNEPENITTVKIELKDSANSAIILTAQWRDVDGAGGNNPVIDPINLKSNTTYNATITILDETTSPAKLVSNEIKEEGEEHQFFFKKTVTNITFVYDDVDKKGNPLGLKSIWRAGANSSGTASIVLKHQPGVKVAKPGDINAGETDLEVTFPLTINN